MICRTRVRTLLAAIACMVLAAGGAVVAAPAHAAPAESRARFIITVADDVDSRQVAEDHRRSGAQVDFVYTAALNGFAGAMSQSDLGALQRDRRVTRIERDGVATASTTQESATWGLDRIDARAGLDQKYSYTATGAGVHAYVVDTGILLSHGEFTGRLGDGFDAVTTDGFANDCNGHGTHVAGTVGGTTYGVAKAVTLHAVRVLDCAGSGSWSGVIAGLDWVATNRVLPAVANMSLGGGASTSVDDAVKGAIGRGVTVVVAAGNGNQAGRAQDACNYSPARVPDAVTIGATTQSDAKTSWSNYGTCVDLFAPGASITSAWYTSNTATNTISGTSMASPHVAGVAALYLEANQSATAQQVRDAMYAATTKSTVTSSKTANNHLLYSLVSGTTIQNGTITGTVTEAGSTTPIGGATVTAGTLTATTGVNGVYTFTLPPGSYVMNASATGYDSSASLPPVLVTEAGTTTEDFALTKTSAEPAPAASIDLSLTAGNKVKGSTQVTSSWTDGDTTSPGTYTVFVNGTTHKTVIGTSETTSWKGSGTLTYQVCRSGTCSAQQSITI